MRLLIKTLKMRIVLISVMVIFLCAHKGSTQEISALVLDSQNRQPIPFATVQYGPQKGVLTNEEGRFSLQGAFSEMDSLRISSLGYEPYIVGLKPFKDHVIHLKASNIELADVFLTNKELSAEEIVERVKEGVDSNYNFSLTQKKFFYRKSDVSNIGRFDLKVDKSTFPDLDQKLMDRIAENIPKITDSYKEVLGDFYGNYQTQKIRVIKAANLHNPQNTASLTALTGKLEQIFKENIKSDSFLKIRSGILGVKVDAEDLEMERNQERQVVEVPVEKSAEEQEKEKVNRQKNLRNASDSQIRKLLQTVFWNEGLPLDIFERSKKYRFRLEGLAQMDNDVVYVISFEPKRKADFKGKMYVNTLDYGIHRLDYLNVKPLRKFRLFGISTSDDVYRGKMIFSKDDEGKYNPRYLEREVGESYGIDRPLTIIEKNKFVAGRRKQNELDLDILIKAGNLSKYQLVVYESLPLEESSYENLEVSEPFEYETFKVYNPEFWDGYNIIEPNAAIKAFTALEPDNGLY